MGFFGPHPDNPPEYPVPGEISVSTGWWWALGFSNPLIRLEWVGWRRRPIRYFLISLLILAGLGALFIGRHGTRMNPGYWVLFMNWLDGGIRNTSGSFSLWRGFWGSVASNFEAAVLRLTTILPYLLALRCVHRLRRSGLWESLRLTRLSPRDWTAGLLGPPIILSAAALTVFLVAVVYPNFLARYPLQPQMTSNPYRTAMLATIPLIGFEGVGNILIVSAIALRESLRSPRWSTVAGRTFLWILVIELAHSVAMYFLVRAASSYPVRWPRGMYSFMVSALPLLVVGMVKTAAACLLFRRLTRTFILRQQEESEVL